VVLTDFISEEQLSCSSSFLLIPDLARMAEEALNLSLDDIIKRNAENNRKKSPSTRGGKRGGRGGRGGRGSSFQPRVQTRVLKPVRGGRQGRGAPRVSIELVLNS